MHSLGNDFVVVELLSQEHKLPPEQIKSLADRRQGIGFDQLLVVAPPRSPDCELYVRVYNSDGEEVEQCGNGFRCVARLVFDKQLVAGQSVCLETKAGVRRAEEQPDGHIRLSMGMPLFEPAEIPMLARERALRYSLPVEGAQLEVGALSLGNPHAVLQVEDVAAAPVERLGAAIGGHACFPQRANVGFMQLIDSRLIALRVYERGVGETPACGSGACAAVVLGRIQGLLDKQVEVSLPGGSLQVEWSGDGADVWLSGPTTTVYDGQLPLRVPQAA